jgi:hypothetical protein
MAAKKGINYNDYKDIILKLKEEGVGSRLIASKIREKANVELDPRYIRKCLNRWRSETSTIENILESNGIVDVENWNHAWIKAKEGSIFIKNRKDLISFDEMRKRFVESVKGYEPKYKTLKRSAVKDPHCLVIDIADLHIGKLASSIETGEEYNSEIAVQRAAEGVAGILSKASGYPLDQIVFVIGNDVLHVDNAHKTTTSGTGQDISRMWFENYDMARILYVQIIEQLMQICDVHVTHNPSNHDYVTGYMLADSVKSWFRNSKNVTFDISPAHRKYYTYGKNLIGTSHGDGAKMADMPLLMANEASRMWADTYFRYIYLHHIHHMNKVSFQSGKDYHGVTVEHLRSVSNADSYHHRNGYQHAPKAVTGFIHHKEDGQVARLTHLFR